MDINYAGHWRRRAKKAWALAAEVKGDQARTAMLGVANDYDELARRAEERERAPRYSTRLPTDSSTP